MHLHLSSGYIYCILTLACTFVFFPGLICTVERIRSFGDESRLESLRAEVVQEKSHKKQLEESAALKQSEVSLELFPDILL